MRGRPERVTSDPKAQSGDPVYGARSRIPLAESISLRLAFQVSVEKPQMLFSQSACRDFFPYFPREAPASHL